MKAARLWIVLAVCFSAFYVATAVRPAPVPGMKESLLGRHLSGEDLTVPWNKEETTTFAQMSVQSQIQAAAGPDNTVDSIAAVTKKAAADTRAGSFGLFDVSTGGIIGSGGRR